VLIVGVARKEKLPLNYSTVPVYTGTGSQLLISIQQCFGSVLDTVLLCFYRCRYLAPESGSGYRYTHGVPVKRTKLNGKQSHKQIQATGTGTDVYKEYRYRYLKQCR
jgi:hypothetical protein